MEIPSALKRLVRMVLRGFYSVEHMLVMDMLIRKLCVKEEDLENLLKFERKHLRSIIAQLKSDKMLKTRLRMETGPEGKATRQNYYYINYKAFVNVVKYKLDLMRRKIETEERDSTKRASFFCSNCKKTFTDLEADQLWDVASGEFKCSYCGEVVDEDSNVMPKADSRLILAKFNEQIEPLYLLLKEVEDLKIPNDLLEPEPIEPPVPKETVTSDPFESGKWKLEKNKNTDSDYENMLFNDRSLTIKIEQVNGSISALDDKPSKKDENQTKKEQPAWLSESTVFESPSSSNSKRSSREDLLKNSTSPNEDLGYSKEILEALLVHEKQQENSRDATFAILHSNKNDNLFSSDVQDEKDEVMDSDDGEMEEVDGPMVKVGGQMIALCDINDDHIKAMNSFEREDYIRLTQEVYSHMYD